MNPISKILVSSSDVVLDKKGSSKAGLSKVSPGQTIEARVVGMKSSRVVELEVAGKRISAKTYVPMKKGDTILLKAEKSGEQMTFKLVGAKGETPLRYHINMLNSMGRAGPFSKISHLINNLSQKTMQGKTSPDLNNTLEHNANQSLKSEARQAAVKLIELGNQLKSLQANGKGNRLSEPGGKADATPGKVANLAGKLINLGNLLKNGQLDESLTSKEMAKVLKSLTPEGKAGDTASTKNAVLSNLRDAVKDIPQKNDAPIKSQTEKLAGQEKVLKDGASKAASNAKNSLKLAGLPESGTTGSIKGPANPGAGSPANPGAASPANPITNLAASAEGLADKLIELGDLLKGNQIDEALKATGINKVLQSLKGDPRDALLPKLREAVENIALKSDAPDRDLLPKLVEKGGLSMENRLGKAINLKPDAAAANAKEVANNDLKALSMKIISQLPESDKATAGALRAFVDGMENLQLLNRFSSEESGRFFMPLPTLLGDELKFGQLFMDLGKDENSDDNPENRIIKVAFLLEMSNIGDVRADFSVLKKGVSGTFYVSSEEVKTLFTENFNTLKENLGSKEFMVQSISCKVMEPEKLSAESLAEEMIKHGEGLLNLVI